MYRCLLNRHGAIYESQMLLMISGFLYMYLYQMTKWYQIAKIKIKKINSAVKKKKNTTILRITEDVMKPCWQNSVGLTSPFQSCPKPHTLNKLRNVLLLLFLPVFTLVNSLLRCQGFICCLCLYRRYWLVNIFIVLFIVLQGTRRSWTNLLH